jgi:hypothetical protein
MRIKRRHYLPGFGIVHGGPGSESKSFAYCSSSQTIIFAMCYWIDIERILMLAPYMGSMAGTLPRVVEE